MSNQIQVVAAPHPIKAAQVFSYVSEGMTLREIVDHIRPPYFDSFPASVLVDGSPIPEIWWDGCRPKSGTLVNVNIVPMGGGGDGGKNPLRTVLTLAIAIAAPYAAPAIGAGLGLSGALANTIGGAIFTAVGGLLVNAIAPPGGQPNLNQNNRRPDQRRDSPTFFIEGARNNKRPDAPVPVVLGRVRHIPPLGADNFTETQGDQQFVRQVFAWGSGPVSVSQLRIGDTPIDDFDDFEVETVIGALEQAPDLTLYPNDVEQEDLSIQLLETEGFSSRSTALGVDEIVLTITFPNGLAHFDDQGTRRSRSVTIEAEYSVAGADTWLPLDTVTYTRAFTSAIRESMRIQVPRGQYDVRVRRVTGDTQSSQILDDVFWTAIKSITNEPPILMENLTVSAVRIRATDQLNGPIDRLSGFCETVALDWDRVSEAWIERETNNPASLYRYIFQGPHTDEPLPDSRLDLDFLAEWHEFCEDNGYTFNMVVDFETTIEQMAADVAAAGRASPYSLDGIRTVVIDREQTVIAQHFTPDNTTDFQGEIVFNEPVHGWRIAFRNEEADFNLDERIVYADGYTAANATILRDLELPGVTNPAQIYKQGREHIATLTLRPEVFTFNMDFENLAAVKGNLCKLTHDVPLFGLHSGRISAIETDGGSPVEMVTRIEVDETIFMEPGTSYSLRYRKRDGRSIVKTIKTQAGSTNILEFFTPFDVLDGPDEGDLFQFGEVGKESVDVIIQSIRRNSDYTAQIRCVPAAPEIFLASQGEIPPFQSQSTLPADLRRPVPPVIREIQTGEEVVVRNVDGSITSRMVLTLENQNAGQVVPVVRIRNATENAFGDAQVVFSSAERVVLEGLDDNERYDLKIFYRRVGGLPTIVNELSAPVESNNVLFEGASGRPDDVENFRLSVIGESIRLTWDPVGNIDLSHYEIRYSPESSGVVWGGAQRLRENVTVNEVTVALQPGTYLIRAVDRSDQTSKNEALVTTNVTAGGVNAVANIVENPDFTGVLDNVRVEASQIVLDDPSLLTGQYTFANSIDLGDVFTSRITPTVVARGSSIGNTLDTWGNLNTIVSLSGGATPQDWTIDVQFRATDDDPAGTPVWSQWQTLVIGNYQFRAIEFRIILNTLSPGITPAISRLEVEVDMPDRILPRKDLSVPVTGLRVDFEPAFKSLESVLITAQSLSTGDYLEKTNEDETGVDLMFFNAAGAPVARTADVTAVGYGSKA